MLGAAHVPRAILCPVLGAPLYIYYLFVIVPFFSFSLGAPLKWVLLASPLPINGCQDGGGTEVVGHREMWLQARRCGTVWVLAHPDSHPLGEDVAGPGGGVRAKGAGSEEANFGWG